MDDIPLSALSLTLVVLLALSAFFSLSETAMMASNRFRLRHLAQSGHHGAQKALDLLGRTDKMLGVILLGNNLLNENIRNAVAYNKDQVLQPGLGVRMFANVKY